MLSFPTNFALQLFLVISAVALGIGTAWENSQNPPVKTTELQKVIGARNTNPNVSLQSSQ